METMEGLHCPRALSQEGSGRDKRPGRQLLSLARAHFVMMSTLGHGAVVSDRKKRKKLLHSPQCRGLPLSLACCTESNSDQTIGATEID